MKNKKTKTKKPVRVLVFSGYGLNCEEETAFGFEKAGAKADIVHINDVIAGQVKLSSYQNPGMGQYLEAVTDADDQLSALKKCFQIFHEVIFHAVAVRFAASRIIPVRESAGERENLIRREFYFARFLSDQP
jgi:hypothetical protein